MPAKGKDKYANMVNIQVEMAAANTLTFQDVNLGISLYDRVALKIERMEVDIPNSHIAEMTTSGDSILVALTTSNQVATLGADERAVIDRWNLLRFDMGTAGTGALVENPRVKDYSGLSGGGILTPPNPLYVAIDSAGLASVAKANIRIYFTILSMADADYFELVEARRFLG